MSPKITPIIPQIMHDNFVSMIVSPQGTNLYLISYIQLEPQLQNLSYYFHGYILSESYDKDIKIKKSFPVVISLFQTRKFITQAVWEQQSLFLSSSFFVEAPVYIGIIKFRRTDSLSGIRTFKLRICMNCFFPGALPVILRAP